MRKLNFDIKEDLPIAGFKKSIENNSAQIIEKSVTNPFEEFLKKIKVQCDKRGEQIVLDDNEQKVIYGRSTYALSCYHHSNNRFRRKEASCHEFFIENCIGCTEWIWQIEAIIEDRMRFISFKKRNKMVFPVFETKSEEEPKPQKRKHLRKKKKK